MKTKAHSVLRYASIGLTFALCASCRTDTLVPPRAAQEPAPQQTGILYLYKKDNVPGCQFNAADGQYAFQNSSGQGCPNDTIYTWRIVQGKPGTVITFKDSSNCDGNSEPSYSFLLTGDVGSSVTTPSDVFMRTSFAGEGGQDIISGIQTYSHGKTGNMDGKLSCVHIWQAP